VQLVELLGGLPFLQFGESAAQHAHGGLPVLDLGALGLAAHDDARRQMGDADGRVGLVDVLAARAGRAVGVHAQVVGIDDDGVVLLDFRHYFQGGERGVPARGGVKG